jgi:hypothetical protein
LTENIQNTNSSICSGQIHSNFALFRSSMTDEEEFAARSQLKWTREGGMDIALSPPKNGPRGPRPRMAGHVAINQGQRSQRYGQPELVPHNHEYPIEA